MSDDTSGFDERTGLEIAIIGMAGRYPGAADLDTFWRNLCEGVESITELSAEDMLAAGARDASIRSPRWVPKARLVEDADKFDAGFFGISPREADIIEPQQRLFLECAWAALEDAGVDPDRDQGQIGVYAGERFNGYLMNIYSNQALVSRMGDFQIQISNDKDYIATRTSYKLDLGGPSFTVQSACSTALVAVHLGCQALNAGECDMAIAGASGIRVPEYGYPYVEGDVGSPDGHVRAFDAKARGTMFGSGVGAVVLKRLDEALADGDNVHAVIRGSAVTNDGADKVGFSAPGVDGQYRVVRAAQIAAEVDAGSIGYVEAHGTGTQMGDPIEVSALTKAFRASTDRTGFCALGSVKSNIGHLGAAAGSASLMKAVLALKHRELPPSINFEEPNPEIDFAASPFFVNTERRAWEGNGAPLRAGVSAFGIGGTNAHVVLEEAPPQESSAPSRPWQLLALSARSPSALEAVRENLARHLEAHPEAALADAAWTLQVGRRVHPHRQVVACSSRAEAIAALQGEAPGRTAVGFDAGRRPTVAFMFTGQGSQYPGMTRDLYDGEPVFREMIDRCAELARQHLDPQGTLDLRDVLYPGDPESAEAAELLNQTAYTQPALFAIEVALAALWRSWGIEPTAMIGHSIGEYAAATVAGVFSLEDAVALVVARGRLMQDLPPGDMLAVPLSEDEIAPRLDSQLSVAAVNAQGRSVVSGPSEAVAALRERLEAEGLACRPLHTSHAFHSPMMEPMLAPFVERFAGVTLSAPRIPFVSNVTGTWITEEEATDPGYWARQVRSPVRFAAGVATLLEEEDRLLVELGPGNSLTTLARRHPKRAPEQEVVPSTRHPKDREDDLAFLLRSLGQLWIAGVTVDWRRFHGDDLRLRISLPTYPFERQRFWIDADWEGFGKATAATGKKPDIADWFYLPAWKPSLFPQVAADLAESPRTWLLLAGDDPMSTALAERLAGLGQTVILATPGDAFAAAGERRYRLAPGSREDYDSLVKAVVADTGLPDAIVHLWNLEGASAGAAGSPAALGLEDLDDSQERAFWSQLYLAQALGKQSIESDIRWLVVSSALHRVRGEARLRPEQATLLGPVKVIPQEYPRVSCRALDLPALGESSHMAELVDVVLAEATGASSDRERVLAVREGERWVRGYETARLDSPGAEGLAIRQEGVYLITGGLGGIGLTFAEYLAKEHSARLVLLGLSTLPERAAWDEWQESHGAGDRTSDKIRKIRALEAAGAEVLALSADVTDPESMRAVITKTAARFGRIDGVIHAAGLAGGGMIQLKTHDVAARVLAPKVRGTLVLEQALAEAGAEPDFMVLCSSTIACAGGLGQVDYCAANSFLDAWAHVRRLAEARGGSRRTVSINWGAWEEVGMAVAAGLVPGSAESPGGAVSTEPIHPLLDRCLREASDQTIYATDFSTDRHWMLAEHRILGTPTLPGTTHLEIARAAFAHHAANFEQFDPRAPIELRDVFFLSPLMLAEGESREVQVFLERDADAFKFRVASRAGDAEGSWQAHARGKVGAAPAPAEKTRVDVAAIRARCDRNTVIIDGPVMDENAGGVVQWGAHWQSLKSIHLGDGEGLAVIELPAEWVDEVRDLPLHPALLDVATGIVGFIEEESYLPLSYGKVTVHAPLEPKLYSHVQKRGAEGEKKETLTVDLHLLSAEGELLVEIERFAMKKVGAAVASFQRSAAPQPAVAAEAQPPAFATPGEAAGEGSGEAGRPDRPRALGSAADGILPAEGVECLRRALGVGVRAPQLVATAKDLHALIEQSETINRDQFMRGDAMAVKGTHDRPSIPTPFVAPGNRVEEKLAEIWQASLGIKEIGINDNFFDLGGDSVMGIQLISRANEAGFELSPDQLFEHQTIAELAALVGGGDGTETDQTKRWEEYVAEQAAGPWAGDLAHWLDERRLDAVGLGVSGEPSGVRESLAATLDGELSERLREEALPALRASLEEAALAALGRALARTHDARRMLVRLTGDGRSAAPADSGFAASPEALAFTFPALFELDAEEPVALVRTVKEQRRSIPAGGASWSALLQHSDDRSVRERLEAMPAPWLGLAIAEDAGAAGAPPGSATPVTLTVGGGGREIALAWSFDPAQVERAAVEALAAATREALVEIARQDEAAQAEAVSALDFPEAGLDDDELSKVLSKLGG